MNKRLLLLATLLVGSLAHASTAQSIDISNTSVISLSNQQPSMSFVLAYPGPRISGLCGVEVRADSHGQAKTIGDLLAALDVKNDLGVEPKVILKNDRTILLDLSAATGGFGTWFSLHTKDGSALEDTIDKTLGPNRTVILLGVTCP